MTDNIPRVWVGCLGCYNAGFLVGDWFDATDAPQEMSVFTDHAWRGWVGPALGPHRVHLVEAHEELWVFDFENFHGLIDGECSPFTARRVAVLIADIERDGYPVEAVSVWAGDTGTDLSEWDSPTREAFEDSYVCESDDLARFAQDLTDDIDLTPVEYRQAWPYTCIDWERAWRELEMSGDYWTARSNHGTYYVFRSI